MSDGDAIAVLHMHDGMVYRHYIKQAVGGRPPWYASIRSLQVFIFIRQVAPVPACWLFKTSETSWPFDLESGVRVACDVGYLCAILVFLGLSVLSLGLMYATDRRQTKKHRLMPPPYGGWRHNKQWWTLCILYQKCQFNKVDRMPTSTTYFRQITVFV